jgi:transposase
MHSPTSTDPRATVRYAGIDWASTDHAVCVLDQTGVVVRRVTVTHTRADLRALVQVLIELGVGRVGIERGDGPVVEALLNAGIPVAVVAPRMVKNLRSRHRGAGKDDRFDAYVLADAIRTDGHRLTDLTPDSPATKGLRALVRARQDLVEVRVGLVNQLRHTLELAFPGAVGLFFDLHSPIARAFLRRFPSAAEAAGLDEPGMAAWLHAEGYSGRTPAATFIQRLQTAPAGLSGTEAESRRHITLALLTAIDAVESQAAELTRRLKEALRQHPDRNVFTSLPRAGQVRAAALLAEIGDARGRYPTWESLAVAAGACPVTHESGKHRAVGFRYGADAKLRRALTDFADDSRLSNSWAADIYRRARARGMRHPHAVRVLARAWTIVIWRCWQTHQPYDPSRHGGLQQHLEQQTAAAA